MGSGKSYWGQRLAKRLILPFVDLDKKIEDAEGKNIADIFAEQGEAEFRKLEQKYLRESDFHAPHILATGGGTPCFFDNMDWMQANGITVYLKTPIAVLAARLKAEMSSRPLLASVHETDLSEHIRQLLELREPVYSKAQIIVEPSGDSDSFLEYLIKQIQSA